MPIHDFKQWARGWILDNIISDWWDDENVDSLSDLLIKAYELGKNPHVDKIDK